jgi:hypothetical protein
MDGGVNSFFKSLLNQKSVLSGWYGENHETGVVPLSSWYGNSHHEKFGEEDGAQGRKKVLSQIKFLIQSIH